MTKDLNKKELKELISIAGKVRGAVFKTDAEYVLEKKGEKGLDLVQKRLKEIGCPIDYKNIKATSWYPIGKRAVSLLVIKDVFGWGNKEIEDMGNSAPKYSFIVKSLVKYFLTFQKTFKESPKYWEKHYMVGSLETSDYDLKKRYYKVRLKNFRIHPILCVYLGGYFVRMGQLIVKGTSFKVKETKCEFKGDPFHEFLVTWE